MPVLGTAQRAARLVRCGSLHKNARDAHSICELLSQCNHRASHFGLFSCLLTRGVAWIFPDYSGGLVVLKNHPLGTF